MVNVYELEIGSPYSILHRRKGAFVAKLLGVEPTKPGDPDDTFLRVEIDTREGTPEAPNPYAWMANAKTVVNGRKTTANVTEKLLRPSLILSIEKVVS